MGLQRRPEPDGSQCSRLSKVRRRLPIMIRQPWMSSTQKLKVSRRRSRGLVTNRWFVSAGYSYLEGEQVNRSGKTGLRPRELPENMFSIWNSFQVTDKFGLGLGLTYQDESFINNGNSAVLPSYTRLDASAYYDVSDKLRVQVNVENLTDELYFPNSHSTHPGDRGDAPLTHV